MVVAAKSSHSLLQREKPDFNKQMFNKIFYLIVFSCINCPLTAEYTSEKHVYSFQILNFKTTKEYCLLR